MVDAATRGDYGTALGWHRALLPANRALGRTGKGAGLSFAKAALRLAGFDVGDPRLPQMPATPEQIRLIEADLAQVPVVAASARPGLQVDPASVAPERPRVTVPAGH
jgi:4-hydroxy-tetrahydrodipicolinate synthase